MSDLDTKKNLIYQVSIGKPSNLYKNCIQSVGKYCEKYEIDHIVQLKPILNIKPNPKTTNRSKELQSREVPLPIFEKENAFSYLGAYDQIAIIDADIYIRPTAPNIFKELWDADFAGVLERDMPLTPEYIKKIKHYSKGQYGTLHYINWDWNDRGAAFYNMGMMLFNKNLLYYLKGDTPEEFIRRREFKKFVDGDGMWKWSTDQTLLNFWVKYTGMKLRNLDWRWNGLYKGIEDKYLKDCYFIHFFLRDHLPNKGEDFKALLKTI